jgi:hypothetical protein
MLVGKMNLEAELDNVLIWAVESGNDFRENLRNVDGAERRNIAQRAVKDVLGKLVIGEFVLLVMHELVDWFVNLTFFYRYWCSARQDAPPSQPSNTGGAASSATGEAGAHDPNIDDEDDDETVRGLPVGVGGVPAPTALIDIRTAAGGAGGVGVGGVVIDGITVGGEDVGNGEGEFGGNRTIRMGGTDENGDMGMLGNIWFVSIS